jgi:hypothetical protein
MGRSLHWKSSENLLTTFFVITFLEKPQELAQDLLSHHSRRRSLAHLEMGAGAWHVEVCHTH